MHTRFAAYSDDELLRLVEGERDPLTTTDAEIELAQRFARVLDQQAANAERLAVLDDYGFDDAKALSDALDLHHDTRALDVRALLDVLADAGIDSAAELKARLALARQFDDIANDAGDLFSRLNTLIASAKE